MPDADTCPCPSCRRLNASFRAACLYCGVTMPNPTARPAPQQSPQAHPDLDKLVRQALTGKSRGLFQLKKVLKGKPKANPIVLNPQDPGQKQPTTAPTPNSKHEKADVEALMGEMMDLVQIAQGAYTSGNLAKTGRYLKDATARLNSAIQSLNALSPVKSPSLPPPKSEANQPALPAITTVAEVLESSPAPQAFIPIELPPQRSAFLLTVDGPGDRLLAPTLASALKIDGATARMHVIARHPKAILRSDTQGDLETLAHRVRQGTSLFATVLSREALLNCLPPKFVLSSQGLNWNTTTSPLWLMEIDPSSMPPGDPSPAPDIVLVVPGTVVIRRFPAQTIENSRVKKRGLGPRREATERRLQVIDVYQKGGQSFRVVLGLTRLDGLPGFVASSALLSMKGFVTALDKRPAVKVVGPKTCHPWQRINTGLGASTSEKVVSGWPVWEEHSRLCLLHLIKATT